MKSGNVFKVNELLLSSHKKTGSFIVFLLVISSLLDFIGLASFLPVIYIIINPQGTTLSSWLRNFPPFVNTDPYHIALVFTVIILLFIVIKTQINIWITHKKASYAYTISANLASRALTRHLKSPYHKFAGIDYTREMNRISNLPLIFANNIIIPFGTLLSEGLLLLIFSVCIAGYDLRVLFYLILIVSPVVLIYMHKRKKMKQISEEVKTIYPRLLKYTLQAIEGLLEIKSFRKETFFKNQFNSAYQNLTQVFSRDHVANTNALRITELIAALSIGVLIIYALYQKKPYQETIILLSIYAGISSRAIPAINRVFAALLQIKSHEYILDELRNMLTKDDTFDDSVSGFTFDSQIELDNIHFSYQKQESIFEGACMTIKKGERIVITGQSGTGKTSLFLILMRFMKEDVGTILVDGKRIEEHNSLGWQRLIGYVPQNPYILDATIAENIGFGIPKEKIDMEKVERLVQVLDLNGWVNKNASGLQTRIGEKGARISGGQRQRLAIARALYHDAEILLLDEATNQLDKQTEAEVCRALENLPGQKTIILISHHPQFWKSFDSVYELRGGRIFNITNKILEPF